jgi:hypothetical protein
MTESRIKMLAAMIESRSDMDPRSMNRKYPQEMTSRLSIHVRNP